MNPNDNPSQQRANELWKHFVGMFGGDAVERKYGPTPPPEWVAMLSRLKKPEIDRGVRRLAYSGAKGVPTLPDFTRLCRTIGSDEFDEGERPKSLPNPNNWQGDDWDVVGSRHLLAHITRRLEDDPQCFGRPATVQAMRVDKSRNTEASSDFVGCVDRLVRAKNLWAADMRDLAAGCGVPVETQKSVWASYIADAEREIAERMAA